MGLIFIPIIIFTVRLLLPYNSTRFKSSLCKFVPLSLFFFKEPTFLYLYLLFYYNLLEKFIILNFKISIKNFIKWKKEIISLNLQFFITDKIDNPLSNSIFQQFATKTFQWGSPSSSLLTLREKKNGNWIEGMESSDISKQKLHLSSWWLLVKQTQSSSLLEGSLISLGSVW